MTMITWVGRSRSTFVRPREPQMFYIHDLLRIIIMVLMIIIMIMIRTITPKNYDL